MSLDLESRLKVFLASAPQQLHPIQTVEISHSAMTQVFFLWREPYIGQIATVEHGLVTVQPVNMQIALAGSESNLDQSYSISIDTTDIEDILREQLDRVPVVSAEKIKVVYREYLSDDLADPLATAVLQVESISYIKGTATLSAVSPRLNITRTGELYAPRDVPMLRGFL